MTTPHSVHFGGCCPFLSCLIVEAHSHPICPDCGAVRYGNAFCPTCVEVRSKDPNPVTVEAPEEVE